MPREKVDWYMKDRMHAHQCCTYYSVVNVDKINYPYSSSLEQEQTWTLTRTMSNHHKRYQSSIENIYLTIPSALTVMIPFSNDYENNKIKIERSISVLPPLPPTRQHALSSYRFNRTNLDSNIHQQQKQKILLSNTSDSKTNSAIKKSRSGADSMRIIHINGEFVVRI